MLPDSDLLFLPRNPSWVFLLGITSFAGGTLVISLYILSFL
ncbi:unnamed protein product [Linum tenue]|uniref:Uncharacterized protein n=1 Tax=Linum tenue TaxID=586396 RepID=A0AAV0JKU1_9ROSI|nr:unnamed protein product [Linum tenue]